ALPPSRRAARRNPCADPRSARARLLAAPRTHVLVEAFGDDPPARSSPPGDLAQTVTLDVFADGIERKRLQLLILRRYRVAVALQAFALTVDGAVLPTCDECGSLALADLAGQPLPSEYDPISRIYFKDDPRWQ